MTSPTDTPKRSDADLVKELHYIVLCHQPGSERRATLEAVCDMIERLSKPPSQGKVERAREIAHNIVSYCREHRSNTDVLTYTRDEAEEYVTAAITQALTEQGTGVETIGAAFRKWWREDCRFGMTETEALASFQEALPVSADGSAWQPIETAPKDGTAIWGYFPNSLRDEPCFRIRWRSNIYERDANWTLDDGESANLTYDPPTYWQPLPSPPIKSKQLSDTGAGK